MLAISLIDGRAPYLPLWLRKSISLWEGDTSTLVTQKRLFHTFLWKRVCTLNIFTRTRQLRVCNFMFLIFFNPTNSQILSQLPISWELPIFFNMSLRLSENFFFAAAHHTTVVFACKCPLNRPDDHRPSKVVFHNYWTWHSPFSPAAVLLYQMHDIAMSSSEHLASIAARITYIPIAGCLDFTSIQHCEDTCLYTWTSIAPLMLDCDQRLSSGFPNPSQTLESL